MSKKPQSATTTPAAAKKPVAQGRSTGRSPIIPARAVALERDEWDEGEHPVAEPTPAAPARANLTPVQPAAPQLSDTLARARARDTVEVPVNPKLDAARADLAAAIAAKALSNWEVAMCESLIDLRDLQDVIDAMTAKQEIIRENIKLALVHADDKTFKFNLGAAALAKGAETVSIVDEKKIPLAYMVSVPDKAKIGRALKVPVAVDGATLTQGKPSLRITWED